MQEIVEDMYCAMHKAIFYNFSPHLLKLIAIFDDKVF